MAKPPSLGTVQKQFLAALTGGVSLVHAVKPWCARDYDSIAGNPLHSRQARRVVALAFLWIVSAWEGFVGDAFLRYIAGAKSPAGWLFESASAVPAMARDTTTIDRPRIARFIAREDASGPSFVLPGVCRERRVHHPPSDLGQLTGATGRNHSR